jgi:hypothetical protein
MSDYPVTRGARPADPHPRLRLAALTAVIVGVILVALAAFLLSYTGIHQIALQAGVAPGLARIYPLMFDATLIIACAGVLATRTAGWGTKTYVWTCLLLVVGAVAIGDALHATGVHLTGQAARATIAVVPWVLLLMGFGIWLVMLRHWRRIRIPAVVNGAEAGRAAQGDRSGHNGQAPAAPTPQADGSPQAGRAPQPDGAAKAVAASAAAGGAVAWAAGRGATAARSRAPQTGIDTLVEQQTGRAAERPRAADGTAAGQAAATGQGKQQAITPGERQPAATTAAMTAGTAAAAGTAAGVAAAMAGGTKPGTPGDTKPGTAEEPKPGTTAEAKPGTTAESTPGATAAAPGTVATTPGSTAGTTPGSGAATSGTADAGAGAAASSGATGPAGQASTGQASTGQDSTGQASSGQDSAGQDKAGTQNHRGRLGGPLEMPVSGDDEEGSVRILPKPPAAAATDAASGQNGAEAGGQDAPASALTEGSKTSESVPAAAADPDPASPPAPLPHFDRPRSTPTPPRETGADGE